jgi:anti-sigma regulatory factor (Ser/Thr protein kinase)
MTTTAIAAVPVDRCARRDVVCGMSAPHAARCFVRSTLGEWASGDPTMDSAALDAELLVSEVVTVATMHSGDVEATVLVSAELGTVRVEVTDPYRGFAPEHDDFEEMLDDEPSSLVCPPGGIGLNIVDRVAARWGVDLSRPGKTVWFELDAVATVRSRVD